MRFFFILQLYLTILIIVTASNTTQTALESCAICYEPLPISYPYYFRCTHNEFHDTCILGASNNTAIPRVETCPLCRALSKAFITDVDHVLAIKLLDTNKLAIFNQFIIGKMLKDQRVIHYVSRLITRDTAAVQSLKLLGLKNWGVMIPILASISHINVNVLNTVLTLSKLSSSHLMYTIDRFAYYKGSCTVICFETKKSSRAIHEFL